jgi:hypothetical protein
VTYEEFWEAVFDLAARKGMKRYDRRRVASALIITRAQLSLALEPSDVPLDGPLWLFGHRAFVGPEAAGGITYVDRWPLW